MANAAMFMVGVGIGVVLLPIQVELVDPADKVADFGLVSGVSANFATVFNPLAGHFSDRFGPPHPLDPRRRPRGPRRALLRDGRITAAPVTADRMYGVKVPGSETLRKVHSVVEHDAPATEPHRRPLPMTDTLVRTGHGPVRGEIRDGSLRFLGIPYARPPVGDLRFAAPAPPEPWAEPLDATAYGPTAQRRPFAEVTTIPEPSIPGAGVLNLNVFTPDVAPAEPLPVLVWIHGGGYVAGSAASPWYDGAAFNRDGVVLVSIGYRLGIEGFLHLEDAPDNRGVRDWIAALEWVRDNIARFGGDPAKVTVAGQSAGGGAVQTLLAVPTAQGLFRAAISVSGAVMRPQGRDLAEAVSTLFTARTGTPAAAAALRDLTDDELLCLQDRLSEPGPDRDTLPMLVLAPFADGELIPRPVPEALLHEQAGADVPLMIGFTAHEFHMIQPAEVGRSVTDEVFRAPALAIAEARARASCPTWLYQFEWTATAPAFDGLAHHCVDLPFAFDLLNAPGVPEAVGAHPPQQLADAIHASWVRFVRDVDPGAAWPPYTHDTRATRIWATEPRTLHDPLRRVRETWLP
ncbi:carboxylesterase/lipase family protein [Streptomyces sp. NPDC002596]|uniref:carboxylesterase/lipase family protein n=1 Tax=Streptomyces sp. NPDC056227 TaxID=3345753 RepID=UPI0035D6F61E